MSIIDDFPKMRIVDGTSGNFKVFRITDAMKLHAFARAQQTRIEKLEAFLGKWKAWHMCEGPMPTFDELDAILKEKI